MTEHRPSFEDDDDDSEVEESRPQTAKPIGEFILHRDEAAKGEDEPKHETLWERMGLGSSEKDDEQEKPSLFSIMNREEDAAESPEETVAEASTTESEAPVLTETEPLSPEEEAVATLEPEEEKKVIEDEIVERLPALQAEASEVEAGSAEEAAVVAVESFHDKLQEKLAADDTTAEQAIEAAGKETLAEIGVPEAEPAAGSPEEPETPVLAEEIPLTPETPPIETEDEDEEDPAATVAGGSGGTTTATPTPSPASGSGGSSSSTPPGGTPFSPFAAGSGSGFGGGRASVAPAPKAPEFTQADVNAAERHGQTTGLVVGGILGYLIGRRRGRIKTEKRLLPVQEKLEKQVKKLHESVATKEQQIRNLAVEKARALDRTKREAFVEQLRPQPKTVQPTPFGVPVATAENRPAAAQPLPTLEAVPPQQPAQLEQIPEVYKAPEAPIPAQQFERVERLSHTELLEASSRVLIDGTSLRTIYEARQITEKGLRHIMVEYLAGRDLKRALNDELLIKQMTYERDPQVRDQLSAGFPMSNGGSAPQGQGAASSVVPGQISVADGQRHLTEAARAIDALGPHEQSDIPNQALNRAHRLERTIVAGWAILVMILITIIFVLLMHRGS